MPLLEVAGGLVMAAIGLFLVSRSLVGLRRAGAFDSIYWASFRHFAGYRVRALRPLGSGLLGVALAVAGLVALYLGIAGFYAGRFLNVSG